MGGRSSATARRGRGRAASRPVSRPVTRRGARDGVRRARRRHRARQRKWVLEAALLFAILVVTIGPFPGR